MPTPTDDRRDLLTVIAHMRAKPGKEDELRRALTDLVEPTSREEGYVSYDLHESVEEPGVFFFYEELGVTRAPGRAPRGAAPAAVRRRHGRAARRWPAPHPAASDRVRQAP